MLVLWIQLFYQSIAPVKEPRLLVLLFSASISYSLVFGFLLFLFVKLLRCREQLLLFLPVVLIAGMLFFMDRYTLIFMAGLAQ